MVAGMPENRQYFVNTSIQYLKRTRSTPPSIDNAIERVRSAIRKVIVVLDLIYFS